MKDINLRIEVLENRHKDLDKIIEKNIKHYENDAVVKEQKKKKLAIKTQIARLKQQLIR